MSHSRRADPRYDTRLVPLAATLWGVAVAVPAMPPRLVAPAILALAVSAGLALVLLRPGHLALALVGAAVGATVTAAHAMAARAGPVPDLAAEAAVVTVELVVRTDPRPKEGRPARPAPYVVFDAETIRVRGRGTQATVHTPVVVVGSADWSSVLPGQVVRATARLGSTDRADRAAALVATRSPPRVLGEPGWALRAAHALRAGLRDAVRPLPPDERGLLPALVVGDVSGLPPDLVVAMRAAGLGHLTAVSGTNLTLLLLVVVGSARWLGLRSWGVPVLGLGVVAGFVLLARAEPSVLRAAAMGSVGLIGMAAGTRRHGLPALCLAVIGLVLFDPWLGRSYGFALSVAATAGILVLGPRWSAALATWMPGWLADALAVPLAAQVACTPLVVMISGEISVVAVPANLLAAPAVAPATVLGFAATLVAPVSGVLASAMAWIAFPAVWWIVQAATWGARLPGAAMPWPVTPAGVVVVLVSCLLATVLAPFVLRRARLLVGLATVLALWLVGPVPGPSLPSWLTAWPPRDWLLVACDVGQGDALVLNAGAGRGVVVDAGPDPATIDRCLDELGIEEVPYVLVTHFHADHLDGLTGVIAGREVGRIGIRPRAPARWHTALRRGLDAERRGVGVEPVEVGSRMQVGDVTWTVLGPLGESLGHTGRPRSVRHTDEALSEEGAENDESIVALAEVRGVRVLLTGDIEPPAQRALLRSGLDLRADVLKVPHHGSRYQDPRFLAAVGARLAIVSVGRDNDYGHPATSTVRLLVGTGHQVARTDLDGAIAVVDGPHGLEVVRRARGRPPGTTRAVHRGTTRGSAVAPATAEANRIALGRRPGLAPGSRGPVGSAWDAEPRWLHGVLPPAHRPLRPARPWARCGSSTVRRICSPSVR